jgi:hypothetical protein
MQWAERGVHTTDQLLRIQKTPRRGQTPTHAAAPSIKGPRPL